MEEKPELSRINQLQDKINTGIVRKIMENYKGARLSVLMQDIIDENELDTTGIHPETVRALGHYASVTAGEATDTAIQFIPETRVQWVDDGYNSKEVAITNEFIIVPRGSYDFKRKPTHEPLSTTDYRRRESKERYERKDIGTHDYPQAGTPIDGPKKPRRRIPGDTSRLINRNNNFGF